MNNGGAFYKVTAAAALDALQSRTSGLTPAEARERLPHIDPLGEAAAPPKPISQQTTALWLRYGLLIAGIITAFYFEQLATAMTLAFVLLGIGLFNGFYSRSVHHNRTRARLRVPHKVTVVRGNKPRRIKASSVVPGDIVFVQAGDIVPADLRIIKATDCTASETIFDQQLTRQTKNSRSLHEYAAPDKQTCTLFYGSSIVSGEAYGVAYGVGKHSQLGQLLGLTPSAPRQIFSERIARRQKQIDVLTLLLIVILAVTAAAEHISAESAVQLGGLILVATSLLDWSIAQAAIAARRAHSIGRQNVRTLRLSSYETIATSRTIVSDLTAAFVPGAPSLRSLHIGKTSYRLDGAPLNEEQAVHLQLPYTVMRLLSESVDDSDYSPLTSRLPSLSHGSFTFRDGLPERFTGVVGGTWQGTVQTITAASGAITAMLGHCSDIWDHGHVRPLTKADKDALLATAARHGANAKALAYAASDNPTSLTLIGYALMSTDPEPAAFTALASLRAAHVGVVLTSDETPERTKAFLKKTGLGADNYTWLSHDDILRLNQDEVQKHIAQKPLVLNDVSVHDIAKVMQAARRRGALLLSGERLEQAQLLQLADSIMARPGNITSDHAELHAPSVTLATLLELVRESRTLQHQLTSARSLTNISFGAGLLVSLIACVATIFRHDAALITPALLLYALVIASLPMLIATGWHFTSAQLMRQRPESLTRRVAGLWHQAFISCLGALIAISAGYMFLSMSHVSAHYLVPGGLIYAEAATVTAFVLGLCLLTHTSLAWLHDTHSQRARFRRNKSGIIGLISSLALLIALLAYQPLQTALGSSGLAAETVWLCLGAGALCAIITFLAELDTRQTRRSIINLRRTKLSRGKA